MAPMIFVNLPVRDVAKATAFYTGLGWDKNEQFSDENASCIVVSDTIFVMLLAEPYFATFTTKAIADATKTTEVLNGLSSDSREQVDELLSRALAGGGTEAREPMDDFMYQRSFQDLDGHVWEIIYMDPANVEGQ